MITAMCRGIRSGGMSSRPGIWASPNHGNDPCCRDIRICREQRNPLTAGNEFQCGRHNLSVVHLADSSQSRRALDDVAVERNHFNPRIQIDYPKEVGGAWNSGSTMI